jgi:hypothetical protein
MVQAERERERERGEERLGRWHVGAERKLVGSSRRVPEWVNRLDPVGNREWF